MTATEFMALLLTGVPGAGKTTAIKRLAQALPGPGLGGFYTEEMRHRGRRVGFRVRDFAGASATLAHVDWAASQRAGRRVSRYGVDVAALDRMVAATLAPNPAVTLYLIDEIGKMECFSAAFTGAVVALLDAGCPLVATIARAGAGFIARVKRRPDVELWEVTGANRDSIPGRVVVWLTQEAGWQPA